MTVLTSLLLAFSLSASVADSPSAEDSLSPKDNQCLVELRVPDMSCPMGCSPVVTRALKSIKGVEKVKVTFKDKLARVIANAPVCNTAGTQTMVQAVKKEGYQCEVVNKAKGAPKT